MSRSFLQQVEEFLTSYPEVTPTTLGRVVLADPSFVWRVRQGRMPRIDTAERMLRWIEDYKCGIRTVERKPRRSRAAA